MTLPSPPASRRRGLPLLLAAGLLVTSAILGPQAAAHGPDGAHDRVKLQVFLHFILFPDTRRINQHKFLAEFVVVRVDRIPCGTGDRRHNIPFFPQQGVGERGFSDVWAAYDGEFGQNRIEFRCVFDMLRHRVQQIARTAAAYRGDEKRIVEAEAPKLVCLHHPVKTVHFIDHQIDRLRAAAQDAGNALVQIRDPRLRIHHEHDNRRFFERNGYLMSDRRLKNVVRSVYKTACIHYRKTLAVPLAKSVLSIARNPRKIIRDRIAHPYQPIIKCGLANVRASHYSNNISHQSKYFGIRSN